MYFEMKHETSCTLTAIKSTTLLTQYIFGAQLPQIFELEIDVNDGRAASDSQDDDVTAGRFLERKRDRCLLLKLPGGCFTPLI